eukprot:2434447-Alexandrium_andersonii.AAC.1
MLREMHASGGSGLRCQSARQHPTRTQTANPERITQFRNANAVLSPPWCRNVLETHTERMTMHKGVLGVRPWVFSDARVARIVRWEG